MDESNSDDRGSMPGGVVSGSLVVRESGRGVIAGSLAFTGPLVAGETEEGDLNASATFDADPIAAGEGLAF